MRRRIPVIEFTDNGNFCGIRRPDSKVNPTLHHVRAQLLIQPVVAAFGEQMNVELAQQSFCLLDRHCFVRTLQCRYQRKDLPLLSTLAANSQATREDGSAGLDNPPRYPLEQ